MAQPTDDEHGPFREEHGRRYGVGRGGEYLLPVDAIERDRLDVLNTMLKTARDPSCRLVHAPSTALERSPTPSSKLPCVMDLACGTGVWLLEMAEKWPKAEYHGFDINNLAPSTLLPNITIHKGFDIDTDWEVRRGEWDIIHLQLALGAVRNWNDLYRRIREHLKPGTGWFEAAEVDWEPRCDDGSVPLDGKLKFWWNVLMYAYQWEGCPITYSETTGKALELAGFQDIQCKEYKIPLAGWNTDSVRLHRSGIWWNIAMSAGEDKNHGLEAMSLRPITKVNGWPPHHVTRLCKEVMDEASDLQVHAYNRLIVWWARAPHPDECC